MHNLHTLTVSCSDTRHFRFPILPHSLRRLSFTFNSDYGANLLQVLVALTRLPLLEDLRLEDRRCSVADDDTDFADMNESYPLPHATINPVKHLSLHEVMWDDTLRVLQAVPFTTSVHLVEPIDGLGWLLHPHDIDMLRESLSKQATSFDFRQARLFRWVSTRCASSFMDFSVENPGPISRNFPIRPYIYDPKEESALGPKVYTSFTIRTQGHHAMGFAISPLFPCLDHLVIHPDITYGAGWTQVLDQCQNMTTLEILCVGNSDDNVEKAISFLPKVFDQSSFNSNPSRSSTCRFPILHTLIISLFCYREQSTSMGSWDLPKLRSILQARSKSGLQLQKLEFDFSYGRNRVEVDESLLHPLKDIVPEVVYKPPLKSPSKVHRHFNVVKFLNSYIFPPPGLEKATW